MIRGFANFDFQLFDLMKLEKISLSEACAVVRSFGYTHMEVGFCTLTDDALAAYRKNGLAISNIFTWFSCNDPAEKICAALDALILKAAEAGSPFVMPLPEDEEGNLDMIWQILQSRADLAASHGVTMILEDFDYAKRTYNNIAGVRAYLDHVPALKCCFDTGNFISAGETLDDAWSQLKTDTVHFHLKDRKRAPDGSLLSTPVGTGDLGLLDFVRARLDEGFSGILALEQSPMENQREASRISIENVKKLKVKS